MKREDANRRERKPTRVPGEGGIELESTAGNLQVKPAETASLAREALPGGRKRKWGRRRGRPAITYKPGDLAPASGIYNVVDQKGRYLFHQRALVEQRETFGPLDLPRAYGYTLAFPARHLAHGPE